MDDKLSAFIEAHGVDAELIPKPSTQQTLKAHEALVAEHFAEEKAVLALIAGTDKLNLAALSKVLGCERVIIADQATAERLSGYPRGGTPPIVHDRPLQVVIDDALYSKPVLYGGGGSTDMVMKNNPSEIKHLY